MSNMRLFAIENHYFRWWSHSILGCLHEPNYTRLDGAICNVHELKHVLSIVIIVLMHGPFWNMPLQLSVSIEQMFCSQTISISRTSSASLVTKHRKFSLHQYTHTWIQFHLCILYIPTHRLMYVQIFRINAAKARGPEQKQKTKHSKKTICASVRLCLIFLLWVYRAIAMRACAPMLRQYHRYKYNRKCVCVYINHHRTE